MTRRQSSLLFRPRNLCLIIISFFLIAINSSASAQDSPDLSLEPIANWSKGEYCDIVAIDDDFFCGFGSILYHGKFVSDSLKLITGYNLGTPINSIARKENNLYVAVQGGGIFHYVKNENDSLEKEGVYYKDYIFSELGYDSFNTISLFACYHSLTSTQNFIAEIGFPIGTSPNLNGVSIEDNSNCQSMLYFEDPAENNFAPYLYAGFENSLQIYDIENKKMCDDPIFNINVISMTRAYNQIYFSTPKNVYLDNNINNEPCTIDLDSWEECSNVVAFLYFTKDGHFNQLFSSKNRLFSYREDDKKDSLEHDYTFSFLYQGSTSLTEFVLWGLTERGTVCRVVLNISDVTHNTMFVDSTYSTLSLPHSEAMNCCISQNGDYLYIADDENGIRVLNYQSNQLEQLNYYPLTDMKTVNDVIRINNKLHSATDQGVRIFKCREASLDYSASASDAYGANIKKICKLDNQVYGIDDSTLYNISNHYTPIIQDVDIYTFGVRKSDTLIFLAFNNGDSTYVTSYDAFGIAKDSIALAQEIEIANIALDQDNLYASTSNGFFVIDVRDAYHMAIDTTLFHFFHRNSPLATCGKFLYGINESNELIVQDVLNLDSLDITIADSEYFDVKSIYLDSTRQRKNIVILHKNGVSVKHHANMDTSGYHFPEPISAPEFGFKGDEILISTDLPRCRNNQNSINYQLWVNNEYKSNSPDSITKQQVKFRHTFNYSENFDIQIKAYVGKDSVAATNIHHITISTLKLVLKSINDRELNGNVPEIETYVDYPLNGNVNFEYEKKPGDTAPKTWFAWTPDHNWFASLDKIHIDYKKLTFPDSIPNANGSHLVNLGIKNLRTPKESDEYYLWFAMDHRSSADILLSCDDPAKFDEEDEKDDIAWLDSTHFSSITAEGFLSDWEFNNEPSPIHAIRSIKVKTIEKPTVAITYDDRLLEIGSDDTRKLIAFTGTDVSLQPDILSGGSIRSFVYEWSVYKDGATTPYKTGELTGFTWNVEFCGEYRIKLDVYENDEKVEAIATDELYICAGNVYLNSINVSCNDDEIDSHKTIISTDSSFKITGTSTWDSFFPNEIAFPKICFPTNGIQFKDEPDTPYKNMLIKEDFSFSFTLPDNPNDVNYIWFVGDARFNADELYRCASKDGTEAESLNKLLHEQFVAQDSLLWNFNDKIKNDTLAAVYGLRIIYDNVPNPRLDLKGGVQLSNSVIAFYTAEPCTLQTNFTEKQDDVILYQYIIDDEIINDNEWTSEASFEYTFPDSGFYHAKIKIKKVIHDTCIVKESESVLAWVGDIKNLSVNSINVAAFGQNTPIQNDTLYLPRNTDGIAVNLKSTFINTFPQNDDFCVNFGMTCDNSTNAVHALSFIDFSNSPSDIQLNQWPSEWIPDNFESSNTSLIFVADARNSIQQLMSCDTPTEFNDEESLKDDIAFIKRENFRSKDDNSSNLTWFFNNRTCDMHAGTLIDIAYLNPPQLTDLMLFMNIENREVAFPLLGNENQDVGVFKETEFKVQVDFRNVDTRLKPLEYQMYIDGQEKSNWTDSNIFLNQLDNVRKYTLIINARSKKYPYIRSNTNRQIFSVEEFIPPKSPMSIKKPDTPEAYCEIAGKESTDFVKLYVRKGGEAKYSDALGFNFKDNSIIAHIPNDYITMRGIEYFVEYKYSNGDVIHLPFGSSPVNPDIVQVEADTCKAMFIKMPKRIYKLISFPFQLEDKNVSNFTEKSVGTDKNDPYQWRLYQSTAIPGNTHSVNFTELKKDDDIPDAGNAFWFSTKHPVPLIAGPAISTPTDVPFKLNIEQGWNLISNPFAFALDWNKILQSNDLSLTFDVFSFLITNNVLQIMQFPKLIPWNGYYIRSDSTFTIDIDPRICYLEDGKESYSHASLEKTRADLDWYLELVVGGTDSEIISTTIGQSSKASSDFDDYDAPLLPYPEACETIYSVLDGEKICRDIRGAGGNKWELHAINITPKKTNRLRIADFNTNENLFYVLVDRVNERNYGIKFDETKSYSFIPSDHTKEFIFYAGDEDYIKEIEASENITYLEIPDAYSLSQNYPNPFNASTTIEYSIKENCRVALELFNVLGRRVAILEDKIMLPGEYKYHFSDMSIASGVYIYRLSSTNFTKSCKMILVK